MSELPHTPDPAQVLDYVGASKKQLGMVFQFDMVDLGQGTPYKYQYCPWKLPQLKTIVAKWQKFIDGTDGWTTSFCENHDQGRSVSRYASDTPEYRAVSAKMLAILLCSLTGTLFIYQGQEIGMVGLSGQVTSPSSSLGPEKKHQKKKEQKLTDSFNQVNIPQDWPIEEYKDIEGLGYYEEIKKMTHNDPKALAEVLKNLSILGRDNARTPMQWDNSAHGGFTEAEGGAWMRVNDSFTEINVAKQSAEPGSVLNFWRQMIAFRKAHADLLVYGAFEVLDLENEDTFVFSKKHGNEQALVALNFSNKPSEIGIPSDGEYILQVSNYTDDKQRTARIPGGSKICLQPWEAHLYIQGSARS